MGAFWRDVRYGLRTLWRTPAFTVVVVLTLALGIGANTAIFSLTDQVLLRLLPVKDPGRLVLFSGKGSFIGRVEGRDRFSYPCTATCAITTRCSAVRSPIIRPA